MIGSRSRSREIALQVLYSCDTVRAPTPELWASTLDDAEATPEVKSFAHELVAGTLGQRGQIDALIATAAENWELSRLAAVDRNILRLAVHELASRQDIPAKVSINEAIELGKRYSTAQSGAFINGILDRVRRDLGRAVDDASGVPADAVGESTGPTADTPTGTTAGQAIGKPTGPKRNPAASVARARRNDETGANSGASSGANSGTAGGAGGTA